jgi:hypothetical protein
MAYSSTTFLNVNSIILKMKIKLLKLGNEKRQRAEVLTITFSDFDLEQWHKIKGQGQIAISWFLLLEETRYSYTKLQV